MEREVLDSPKASWTTTYAFAAVHAYICNIFAAVEGWSIAGPMRVSMRPGRRSALQRAPGAPSWKLPWRRLALRTRQPGYIPNAKSATLAWSHNRPARPWHACLQIFRDTSWTQRCALLNAMLHVGSISPDKLRHAGPRGNQSTNLASLLSD